MSTAKSEKQSKLSKYMKAPIRVLIMARDFYVRSMSERAGQVGFGDALGCPTGQVIHTLPRSFSAASSTSNRDEDYRELLRAASTRSLGSKIELEQLRRQQSQKPGGGRKTYNSNIGINGKFPRSVSVGIGRIDEDKRGDFQEQDEFKVKADVLSRSRSYGFFKKGKIQGILTF